MENIVIDTPNLVAETVPVKEASSGLDSLIAAKMTAMRNQVVATIPAGTGSDAEAKAAAPVAPPGEDVGDDSNTNFYEPEVAEPEAEYADSNDDQVAQEDPVSTDNSSEADIIDFIEFAEQHPNAKFKFKRNGKEIEIDAKKAASILGQGAAISEDARQLKIEKAEFDEYRNNKRAETDGLLLAMEFTVRPQLQRAYDEIIKTQGYQNTFAQQLGATQDPSQRARIEASMQQNERYIAQQATFVNTIKPNLDEFYNIRRQQVTTTLETNRKGFQDKELRNSAIYNEVREKVAKDWSGARGQLVPGVDNIDLVSADEHILSLLRDGLKYRDKPKARAVGNSIAALTTKRTAGSLANGRGQDDIGKLREQARGGDKKAADNLLVAQMSALRAARNGR